MFLPSLGRIPKKRKMKDFVAIDFEAANDKSGSICSVGIVVVKNGEIINKFYSLIRPRPNYYSYWHSKIHGLHYEDTYHAPSFVDVWGKVSRLIEGLPLVAHDKHFDERQLRAVFQVHKMEYPGYKFYDTLEASRKAFPNLPNHKLCTVAAQCGYVLKDEHNALSDAMACAWIAREIL